MDEARRWELLASPTYEADVQQAQMWFVQQSERRKARAKAPTGTRRKSDHVGPVKKYDAAGNRM